MTPVFVLLSIASAAVIEQSAQSAVDEIQQLLAASRDVEEEAVHKLKAHKAHRRAHAHVHRDVPSVSNMMQNAEQNEAAQEADDQEKMRAYERMQASQAEMAEQRAAMAKAMKASGASGMIESPQAIQGEINEHMRELQPHQQAFGEAALNDLEKLQHEKVTEHNAAALDYAARKSQAELATMTAETDEKPMKRWVDTTAQEIIGDRKKVHDTAMQLEKDFFSTKPATPPASLLQVPQGPGSSLVQHTSAALLGSTDDVIERAKNAQLAMSDESKNLEANFEKSFERGMAEGFAAEKKRHAAPSSLLETGAPDSFADLDAKLKQLEQKTKSELANLRAAK